METLHGHGETNVPGQGEDRFTSNASSVCSKKNIMMVMLASYARKALVGVSSRKDASDSLRMDQSARFPFVPHTAQRLPANKESCGFDRD